MSGCNDFLARLNAVQREAVTVPGGPVLVTAGAGSGKTSVLVYRIAWLIRECGIEPWQIVAVTFTNKAARELKERVKRAVGEDNRAMPLVGTFHGLSNRFLRIYTQEASLPDDFSIIDDRDQRSFIAELLSKFTLKVPKWNAKMLQSRINNYKEMKVRASEAELAVRNEMDSRFVEFYRLYEYACEERGLIDFSELMLRTVELMEHNQKVREEIQEKYRHLLVDEFQDTNLLQFRWMENVGGKHRNITIVGDEDQSIYGWRGALSGNLQRFEEVFPDAKIIRLEENYRSTQNILAAANALIENNHHRYEKKLWSKKQGEHAVQVVETLTETCEAQYIAKQIVEMRDSGYRLSDIAILYRTNAQSRNFEQQLPLSDLPFRVFGGLRFYQRKEIKEVLSYLSVLNNPNNRLALMAAINIPPRGVGQVSKDGINQLAIDKSISLWDACVMYSKSNARASTGVQDFVEIIHSIQEVAQDKKLSQIIGETVEKSGLLAHYQDREDEMEKYRVDNLRELINAGADFERSVSGVGIEVLAEYLDTVVLDSGDTHDDEGRDEVQLMTLHTAKGLEFPVVFLTGLDENVLPHYLSIQTIGQRAVEGVQEERRLCYVGMTRAEEILYLTRARGRMLNGNYRTCKQSRFLKEIPLALTKRHDETTSGRNKPGPRYKSNLLR